MKITKLFFKKFSNKVAIMGKEITYKELREAVRQLTYEGVIDMDGDLVDKLGYSKGTISAYLSGKTSPSPAFLKKFEDVFKLDLTKFEETGIEKKPDVKMSNGNRELIDALNRHISFLEKSREEKNEYIASLKEQIQSLKDHNKELKDVVLFNLDAALKNLVTHHASTEARQEVVLRLLSKDDNDYTKILDTVYTSEVEKMLEYGQKGISLKTDNPRT